MSSKRFALTQAEAQLAKPTLEDVVKMLGSLTAVYGQPKDRSPALAEIMAREWHRSLQSVPWAAVQEAVRKHIGKSKFWPVPAEIIDLAESDAADLRQRVKWAREDLLPPRTSTIEYTRNSAPYERPYFKPSEEEIQRVSAMIATYKKIADPPVDRVDEWAPASQAGASDALKALWAKQRAQA